ncbi:Pentatricopeptide repeat-containing protein [Cardamine amara subsp. amara]|uniref:Pentatricopeptide repeat-containing protein n=1 Tax=Cardamine amara subsp. amara TaxID=228776 RepID=A0ABD1C6X8_CARAN
MTHRKILLGLNISKYNAYRKRYFSSASAAVRYPLGRDPSSLPSALTEKLPHDRIPCFDDRPVSLRYRVNSMIELSQLDKAMEISRFAGSRKHRDGPKTTLRMCNEIISAMIDAKRNEDAIALFHYFFNECDLYGERSVGFSCTHLSDSLLIGSWKHQQGCAIIG